MVLAHICALSTGFSNAHLVQLPKISGLPAPHPLAISADGKTVVGQFAPGQPFTWRGGEVARFRPSSNPKVLAQYAQAVSADGQVIVGQAGGAYVWTRHKGLQMIGNASSFARAVNEKGTAVACQVQGNPDVRGYLWTKSGVINFDSFTPTCISGDGKVVAGIRADHTTVRAYEFRNQVSQELPLPDIYTDSSAYGVNKDGSVIVGGAISDENSPAAFWKNGKFVKLDLLGQANAVAKTVARDGSFIGGYAGPEAVVWKADGTGNYLEMILKTSGASTKGWRFESIDGLARVGNTVYVTGWAHVNDHEAGYWASFRVK
ncbi:MAG: hypothetical protein GC165_09885 [Armatimonadetes bacterium]|nr:hypothetical protein [Armatimonadota bacterium]